MKVYVVLIHNILIEYKIFESTMIVFMFAVYIILQIKYQPIVYKKINEIDRTSHALLVILTHLKIIVISSEIKVIQIISVLVILILNYSYIISLILNIFI